MPQVCEGILMFDNPSFQVFPIRSQLVEMLLFFSAPGLQDSNLSL